MADTDVTVKVPNERVGAFHRFFGSWLDDPDLILVSRNALGAPTAPPWGEDDKSDELAARAVLRASTPSVEELIATLLDSAGTPVDETTVADRCGVKGDGAVTQLVAALAATCHEHHRRLPISWVKTGDHVQYWLPASAKTTWRQAFKPPKEAVAAVSEPPSTADQGETDAIDGEDT